jgi:tetratricopeptide (TPR) repeat protein
MRSILAAAVVSALAAVVPAAAQGLPPGLSPLEDTSPANLKRYTQCMELARREPIKALPMAEKWQAEGGGLGARHCRAISLFETGHHVQAATQLEAIANDVGLERPGLRAELYVQAGQAWMEANQAENAAAAQSKALGLKSGDADLWIDRGISYAAMRAWPRAISDFDRALELRPKDVDTLVLRAAAWRNAGDPARALADAQYALRIAPDHSEALLEHGFASLARGDRTAAEADFSKVLALVPPGSEAARRAQSGLRGELPASPPPSAPPAAPAAPAAPATPRPAANPARTR